MIRFFLFLVMGVGAFFVQSYSCGANSLSIRWWKDQQVIEALSLTPEQGHKIEELVHQSRERREERRKKIKELRQTIPRLLSAPVLDKSRISSAVEAIGELESKQREDLVTMRMEVRQVLSRDQFSKLIALIPDIMQDRWIPRRAKGKRKKDPQTP